MSAPRPTASDPRPHAARRVRSSVLAIVAALAVAVTGIATGAAAPVPAGAATNSVSNATFEWSISDETNAASFNGQCNYWSAGESDSTAATYTATDGNATVLKLDATDTYVPISDYANRCKDKFGAAVNFLNGAPAKRLGQKVRFTGGTGTVDPATGAASIQWTGTFSVNFYGTLVPFWITDPKLAVDAAGNGTVVAAMGGFASDQADPEVRVPLPDEPSVVIATLAGVGGANSTGFTTTPVYGGVEYDVDPESGQAEQNRVNAGWGAWPEQFVDFQMATGLGSYWYSSGSSVDVRKPPTAITVGYGTLTPVRSTTATPSGNLNPIVANSISVAGSGFTGLAPSEQGIYTGLVKASDWQPGQVPDIADFIGATYTPKAAISGGAFSTTVTVPANAVTDPDATYGIATLCAHGCSLGNRSFDSFTPVDFVDRHTTVDPGVVDRAVANSIAVTGSSFGGFASSPPPGDSGIYTGLVDAADWQPGQVPDAADFIGTTFTPKASISGGSFTTTVSVPANTITDPLATYGIATFCAHGCAVTNRAFDTFTPVNVVDVSPDPAHAVVGSDYGTYAAPPVGVAPFHWSVTSGSLPPGVVLDPATGLVAGTPTTEGRFTAAVTGTDSGTRYVKKATTRLRIDVAPADFRITTETLPGIALRVPYSATIEADGGVAPYRFKVVAGTKPQGITVTGAGIVKGTSRTAGDHTFTVQVTDKFGYTATRDFTVSVAPAAVTVTIDQASLPAATAGQPYSQTLTASGGTSGPYRFRKVSGQLPPKVTLAAATGVLSGTPTKVGSSTFSVTATDRYGYVSAPVTFTVAVG